jgi:hypothetical protein
MYKEIILCEVNIMQAQPVILGLLNNQNISVREVSEISKVPFSTLNNAMKKPIETWSIRVLNAFALALNQAPSKLLEILQPNGYELRIDNDAQTIQGVYIPDKVLFTQIRFVVENQHLEGWKPDKKDIEYLLDRAYNPDPELDDAIDKLVGDKVDAR